MNDQTATPSGDVNQTKFNYKKFVETLKTKGRTDEEISQLVAGSVRLTAMDLYVAMMTNLTDEDLAELDKLPTEKEIMKRAEELFIQRTGMTLDELADQAQTGMLQAAVDV